MMIDEAIDFCNEKSKNIKLRAEPQTFVMIAEMLKDLKAIETGSIDDLLNRGFTKGYREAVDEFCNIISKYRTYDDYGNVIDVLEIAEQLKKVVE